MNDSKKLTRAEKAKEKRVAIIQAAKNEFISKGFEAARIDEIAKKANVAKGTVYLYFPNKEELFNEMIRTVMMPLIDDIKQALDGQTQATKELYEPAFSVLLKRMLSAEVGPVMRLMISEAIRFPKLGEFFRQGVVAPIIEKQKMLLKSAGQTGKLRNPLIAEYPQLILSPILLTVIWQGLFKQFVPDDVSEMMKLHFELLFKN
ncbi:MAG: TetR/AcrR family transcriptional regulator [Planctomycetaceae bacterium]|nr:TetR/AcrR family transcriptional regulator [Planctomycetaceae bacterium]